MTEEEKIICKQFLNDADKTHSCNEYKLLMALLEQEPFINKPCISSGVCEHDKNVVIDKIRAEILRISSYKGYELGGVKDGYRIAIVNVLNIIDKYKAESENKE